MFFGFTQNTNLSTGPAINSTELMSKAATTPINKPYIPAISDFSLNTDVVAQQQIGFVLSDFLIKYRWEIGLAVAGIAVGAIIYYSTKEEEHKKY
jgi:hypothetical protein